MTGTEIIKTPDKVPARQEKRSTAVAGFTDTMPRVNMPVTPPTRVNRLVLWLLVLGIALFGGLGTWAFVTPITSAIVAQGQFKVDGDRLVVQHREGGIVRRIAVREGDVVEEGEPLIWLDDTQVAAQLGIARSQLAATLARAARLDAEAQGKDDLTVPAELQALIDEDPSLADLVEAERGALKANARLLASQIEVVQNRIAQLDEQLSGLDARHRSQSRQLAIANEDLATQEALVAKGLTTKARLLSARQAVVRLEGDLSETDSRRDALLEQKAEMRERIIQLRRARLQEVLAERQDVQAAIFSGRERLQSMRDFAARHVIRAPRAGRVVGLKVNTIGEVIAPGQELLELVPADAVYVIEARVSPKDIDDVIPSGPARVRLLAYNFRTTPVIRGRVVHVSADAFTDAATGRPYFLVKVLVPEEELAAIPNARPVPGMPAQVMLETGEHTVADYILDPVLVSVETAMREH
ncbi:MAG: HlyD family type I secretion periplasmic adaptor subunit [Alphaproteobacteria bacterium]|nr:MAG: HlyD family type I secretion periplasmic adaptor subunit [Alphaproteobacteria bacterium]